MIKKCTGIIFEYIVVMFIIEVFAYYFQCLPRLADYINNSQLFKTEVGSTFLWMYLESVPMIISVFAVAIYIKKYLKKVFFDYLMIKKNNCLKFIFIGVGLAILNIILIVLLENGLKLVDISSSNNIDFALLIVYFVGFILQCLVEEIIYRGIVLGQIKSEINMKVGCLVSSILFSMSHIGNDHFGIVPAINLFLFGVLMCFLLDLTKNMWTVISFHVLWNYLQANFWGMEVSGITFDTSVFIVNRKDDFNILTGGEFGVEGGVICTFLLLISIVAVYILYKKRNLRNK